MDYKPDFNDFYNVFSPDHAKYRILVYIFSIVAGSAISILCPLVLGVDRSALDYYSVVISLLAFTGMVSLYTASEQKRGDSISLQSHLRVRNSLLVSVVIGGIVIALLDLLGIFDAIEAFIYR